MQVTGASLAPNMGISPGIMSTFLSIFTHHAGGVEVEDLVVILYGGDKSVNLIQFFVS